MRIDVTSADIFDGQPCDAFRCPLALAINRATGRDDALVTPMDVVFGKQPGENAYDLPPIAQMWIRDFDRIRQAEPFWFEMDLIG